MSPVTRLILTLAICWVALSLMFKTQLLVLGVLSVGFVSWWSVRLRVLWHRGQPLYFPFLGLIRYWSWLVGEIFRSNLQVTRIVLARDVKIAPALRLVEATPDTDIGRVIYANSITLTPGTTAINFTPEGQILVHALQENSLDELEEGEMARRVRQIEPHIGPLREH